MIREKLFRGTLTGSAAVVAVVVLVICGSLVVGSLPVLKVLGMKFFVGTNWDPVAEDFGALPFLAGTLLTSFLALAISLPLSLAISILLGEYLQKGWLAGTFRSLVDLIAAIPSVIYGFWGLMFLVPLVRDFEVSIGVTPSGVGIFTTALVLSVMIIPNTASIAREVIELVPRDLKEAGYSFGATRFEVLRRVVLPYARSGILAGILLSLGRALGETMAVTMVIGNTNMLPERFWSWETLFGTANTMSSVIANELAEAQGVHYSALVGIGLVLFLVTTAINFAGTAVIRRCTVQV